MCSGRKQPSVTTKRDTVVVSGGGVNVLFQEQA